MARTSANYIGPFSTNILISMDNWRFNVLASLLNFRLLSEQQNLLDKANMILLKLICTPEGLQ
jgi:hypothetical protein